MLDANMNVKIGDFGFSRTYKPYEPMVTSCGSLNYAAPEIVNGVEYTGNETDVWSLGVILYAMILGDLPFVGTNDVETARFITTAQFRDHAILHTPIHQAGPFNPGTYQLFRRIFVVEPNGRIPMPELRRHPVVWLDRPFLASLLRPFAQRFYPKQRMTPNAVRRMKQAAEKQPVRSRPSSSSSSSGLKTPKSSPRTARDDDGDNNDDDAELHQAKQRRTNSSDSAGRSNTVEEQLLQEAIDDTDSDGDSTSTDVDEQ
jgi:serine/threonine protein kinase